MDLNFTALFEWNTYRHSAKRNVRLHGNLGTISEITYSDFGEVYVIQDKIHIGDFGVEMYRCAELTEDRPGGEKGISRSSNSILSQQGFLTVCHNPVL